MHKRDSNAPNLRDPNDKCPICTEPLSGTDNIKPLRCGHGMHYVPCFTRFMGNTVGEWVHMPGRIDPHPQVGPASLGICLTCPICRDFAPYVYIADSDTTLEFRECVINVTSLGAPLTFCEMQHLLDAYKASGLTMHEFMHSLPDDEDDEDNDDEDDDTA